MICLVLSLCLCRGSRIAAIKTVHLFHKQQHRQQCRLKHAKTADNSQSIRTGAAGTRAARNDASNSCVHWCLRTARRTWTSIPPWPRMRSLKRHLQHYGYTCRPTHRLNPWVWPWGFVLRQHRSDHGRRSVDHRRLKALHVLRKSWLFGPAPFSGVRSTMRAPERPNEIPECRGRASESLHVRESRRISSACYQPHQRHSEVTGTKRMLGGEGA